MSQCNKDTEELLLQYQDKGDSEKVYQMKMAPSNIHFNGANIFTTPRLIVIGVLACVVILYTNFFGVFSWDQRVNMKELLSVSIELAERGGREVRRVHEAHKGLHAEVKGETLEGAKEMKTEGDLASHRAMVYGMLKAFPSINVGHFFYLN